MNDCVGLTVGGRMCILCRGFKRLVEFAPDRAPWFKLWLLFCLAIPFLSLIGVYYIDFLVSWWCCTRLHSVHLHLHTWQAKNMRSTIEFNPIILNWVQYNITIWNLKTGHTCNCDREKTTKKDTLYCSLHKVYCRAVKVDCITLRLQVTIIFIIDKSADYFRNLIN